MENIKMCMVVIMYEEVSNTSTRLEQSFLIWGHIFMHILQFDYNNTNRMQCYSILSYTAEMFVKPLGCKKKAAIFRKAIVIATT